MGFFAVAAACLALFATVALGASPRLSAARFSKIDRTLTAQIAVDKPNPPAAALSNVERACKALGTKDKLLSSIRNTCLSGVTILRRTPAWIHCTVKTCMATSQAMLNGVQGLVKHMKSMNTQVTRNVGPGKCRNYLKASSHDFEEAQLLTDALYSVMHATQTLDPKDEAAAEDAIRKAQASAKNDPSAVQERAMFRRACR